MLLNPAEKKIAKLEKQIAAAKKKLGAARMKAPRVAVPDAEFNRTDGKPVKLSQLFGKKDQLILIHNMGRGCPYCTLWADGFQGLVNHLQNRASFVMETPDSPKDIQKFAKGRGWTFPVVSSQGKSGSAFRKAAGFLSDDEGPAPGCSTYEKDKKGRIHRVSRTYFGPGDSFCVAWDFDDLLPSAGGKQWHPKFKY